MRRGTIYTAAVLLAGAVPLSASAATMNFQADLEELNDSGVGGVAVFKVNTEENTITARVRATGLAPNTLHPQHIHGRFEQQGCEIQAPPSSPVAGACLENDMTRNSVVPTVAQNDIDGDGFLETVEGLPAYGPIILNLADAEAGLAGLNGSFPMSDRGGTLIFTETYDLDETDLLFDPLNDIEHEPGDLFPLEDRVYVIHGVEVDVDDPAVIGSMFEINDVTDGPVFFPLLPGAAAQVRMVDTPAPIPLPAGGLLLMGALGGLGAFRALRRKR